MSKKKIPVPLKVLIIIVICIWAVVVALIFRAGYHIIKEIKSLPPVESTEAHVVKTLPQFSDYDMWLFGVRDYTIYEKYYYEDEIPDSVFEENEFFEKTVEDDVTPLRNIIRYYEDRVDSTKGNGGSWLGDDLSEVYDFDMNLLRNDDCYYYFEAKSFSNYDSEYEKRNPEEFNDDFYDFNLYIYCDKTLYIMHNDT